MKNSLLFLLLASSAFGFDGSAKIEAKIVGLDIHLIHSLSDCKQSLSVGKKLTPQCVEQSYSIASENFLVFPIQRRFGRANRHQPQIIDSYILILNDTACEIMRKAVTDFAHIDTFFLDDHWRIRLLTGYLSASRDFKVAELRGEPQIRRLLKETTVSAKVLKQMTSIYNEGIKRYPFAMANYTYLMKLYQLQKNYTMIHRVDLLRKAALRKHASIRQLSIQQLIARLHELRKKKALVIENLATSTTPEVCNQNCVEKGFIASTAAMGALEKEYESYSIHKDFRQADKRVRADESLIRRDLNANRQLRKAFNKKNIDVRRLQKMLRKVYRKNRLHRSLVR